MNNISPMHSIVEKLLAGDASCLTQDVIANINSYIVYLLNKEPLTEVEQGIVDDILHISNIIYNNTDRSILVLEDGVYDMLLEKYKRYNPNFQVGAEPVELTNFSTSDVEFVDEEPKGSLFEFQPYMNTNGFLFGNELTKRNSYGQSKFVDSQENKTISKRLRNTSHKYPQLVGTLHKAKFVLDSEAINCGVYNDPNVRVFERDFLRKHAQAGIINPNYIELVLELKYDGVSIEAEVTDKVLSARTRGETQMDKASDLTSILQGYTFTKSVGKFDIKPFGMKFEAVISYNAIRQLNAECGKTYANARNAIIGILGNSKASKYAKYITLVPLQTSHDNMTRDVELEFMNRYYSTGEPCRYTVIRGDYNKVLFLVKKFVEEAQAVRDVLPFMYDGVVVSYLDPQIRKTLGRSNSINEYSIAIKFQTKKKLTRCRGISYTVGATGDITPMIHYDPVEFYGMINTKSSGHSYARFMKLNLRPNDILEIEFTNDVMAYVHKANVPENDFNPLKPFGFITNCPECGQPLSVSDTSKSVFCSNIGCPGRTRARLINMVSKLGFKGFSEETIKTLNLTSFNDLMSMTEERAKVLGPTNAENLIKAIDHLYDSKVPDYILLGSLGFSDIGDKKWKLILKKVSLHELATDSDMSLYYKLENSGRGIGPKTATTIIKERQFFIKDLVYICNNMPNVITSKGLENDKVTLCKTIRFSGVRDKELENRLTIQGHDCSEGSVTKTTDFLLVPFVGYTSSKVDKANKYGVKILTLDEFRLNESSYLSEV
nr:MAG TPA: DNA ligase [Caudoviricetes sp.]